jgi:septum formation protein
MTPLILASTSTTRLALLAAAGLHPTQLSPAFDEKPIRQAQQAAGKTAGETANALAEAKARAVSDKRPGSLVIGADQILECDGVWFEKPADRGTARRQLLDLRGRTHRLWTAVATVKDGVAVWHHIAVAEMTMRTFSDAFLDAYLDRAGPEILRSVGAYQLEGAGVQLFDDVSGDFFGILGLPLLPLLGHLRAEGVLAP